MKVGDILTYAYHYNARYPQFVRVTRMTAKSIWVEKLQKQWVTDDGYGQNGTVIPNLDVPGTLVTKGFRIKTYKSGNEYVKIDGCYAFIWDGTPEDEYTD